MYNKEISMFKELECIRYLVNYSFQQISFFLYNETPIMSEKWDYNGKF